MRRLALLALLAMLALSSGATSAVTASAVGTTPSTVGSTSSPAATPPSVGSDAFAQQTAEPQLSATTNITVQLRADRDARWQIEMRYPLDSDNETEAFREYGEAFENGDADGALTASTFEYLAEASSTVAGRQMAVQNVSRTATVTGDVGVLRLSFTWTAFLSSDGEHLVLRDAFRLPDDRTWLATLEPTQRLVIETPPGYAINATNAPVVQRSGSVIIDGPRTFDTEEPLTIRYEPTTEVAGYPWELVAGAGVALIVVLAMLVRRRQVASDRLSGGDTGPESPSTPAAETATENGGTETGTGEVAAPEATPETAPSGEGGADADALGADTAGAAGGTGDGAPSEERPEVGQEGSDTATDEEAAAEKAESEELDLSLLSDAERIEHLLDRNGGRMRQADIVDATDWSDAKVSQLLSSMADEDRIEKLRLGRENLISLPEDETDTE